MKINVGPLLEDGVVEVRIKSMIKFINLLLLILFLNNMGYPQTYI